MDHKIHLISNSGSAVIYGRGKVKKQGIGYQSMPEWNRKMHVILARDLFRQESLLRIIAKIQMFFPRYLLSVVWIIAELLDLQVMVIPGYHFIPGGTYIQANKSG